MPPSRDFRHIHLAPNANLVVTRDFGDILFGCPPDVVKPLRRRKTLVPDYCVITLRTMRYGHNLLDVEFLYYAAAFSREGGGKLRILCNPAQKARILTILRESLYGPSFEHLMLALLPASLLRIPGGRGASPRGTGRGEDVTREAVRLLLAKLSGNGRLRSVFHDSMRANLSQRRIRRRVSPYFADLEEIQPGKHAQVVKAWVQAMFMRRECDYFGRYPDDPDQAIACYVEFILFDRHGEAVLQKGRKRIRIRQAEACFFEIIKAGKRVLAVDMRKTENAQVLSPKRKTPFSPPEFGVTFVGSGTGFTPGKLTTCNIVWAGAVGVSVDLVAESVAHMRQLGIARGMVRHVVLTHTHGDHDAGLIQRILAAEKITLLTSRVIYESFLRKAEAVTCIVQEDFERLLEFVALVPGRERGIPGIPHTRIRFDYSFHPIPTGRAVIRYHGPGEGKRAIGFSGDTMFDPAVIKRLEKDGQITHERGEALLNFLWDADMIIHEAGGKGIHTEVDKLASLPAAIRKKTWLNHLDVTRGTLKGMRIAREGRTITLIKGAGRQGRRQHQNILRKTGLFDHLADKELDKLMEEGKTVHKKSGTVIVREGDYGETFFVILSGMAVVEKGEKVVNEYETGDFFGELAILSSDHRRKASVIAQTDIRLFVITGAMYRKYRLPSALEENLYNLVGFFSDRTTPALLQSLAGGEVQFYSRGEDIILLGARDRTAYVLLSGTAEALDIEHRQLGVLQDVDVFGEIAAMDHVRRTATVRAKTDVKVLKLREAQIRDLLTKFPSFYATLMQKKRHRLRKTAALRRILRDHFGFR